MRSLTSKDNSDLTSPLAEKRAIQWPGGLLWIKVYYRHQWNVALGLGRSRMVNGRLPCIYKVFFNFTDSSKRFTTFVTFTQSFIHRWQRQASKVPGAVTIHAHALIGAIWGTRSWTLTTEMLLEEYFPDSFLLFLYEKNKWRHYWMMLNKIESVFLSTLY